MWFALTYLSKCYKYVIVEFRKYNVRGTLIINDKKSVIKQHLAIYVNIRCTYQLLWRPSWIQIFPN